MTGLDLFTIDRLTCGRLGTHDAPCPLCAPYKSPHGQRRKVMRVWRVEPNFATFHCERCGESGYVRARHGPEPDPMRLAKARAEAAERDRVHKADRLAKARWLWSQRKPIAGTIAERYLRRRGYHGPIPATLGFLPGRGSYPPAMIGAFGMSTEPEPGSIEIADDAVRGVHLTRLLPDGSWRLDGETAKVMMGHSSGWPIVLAPLNDLLGLAVVEGIEDGVSVLAATGLGVWVAGCASRMAAIAPAIPTYTDCVTVYAHADEDGRQHSLVLANALRARGFEVFIEGLDK
jgi:Toprim domain